METKKALSGAVHKKTVMLAALGVAIVAIALICWFAWTRPRAPHVTFAPQGQVISGFPKDLVLDTAAIVDNSYAIGYSANLNQYTANWTSPSSSLEGLYDQYLSYFTSNGWTITNSSTNIAAFRGIYAVTSTADANVTMDDSGAGGLKVTVSYVKK